MCIIYSRKASGLVESERGGRGDREHTRKGTVRGLRQHTRENIVFLWVRAHQRSHGVVEDEVERISQ